MEAEQTPADLHSWVVPLTKIIGVVVHTTFLAVVFVISSRITFRSIADELKWPGLFFRALFVTTIPVPFPTAAVVKIFDTPLILAGVMLIAGVTPGDSFALLEAKGKKGNVKFAAAVMVLLCLIMPFTVPVWLWLVSILGLVASVRELAKLNVASHVSIFVAVSLALIAGCVAGGPVSRPARP